MLFPAVVLYSGVAFGHQGVSFHGGVLNKGVKFPGSTIIKRRLPVNVELVKILTIFELTGGKFSNEPAKIVSMVRSSILFDCGFEVLNYTNPALTARLYKFCLLIAFADWSIFKPVGSFAQLLSAGSTHCVIVKK